MFSKKSQTQAIHLLLPDFTTFNSSPASGPLRCSAFVTHTRLPRGLESVSCAPHILSPDSCEAHSPCPSNFYCHFIGEHTAHCVRALPTAAFRTPTYLPHLALLSFLALTSLWHVRYLFIAFLFPLEWKLLKNRDFYLFTGLLLLL